MNKFRLALLLALVLIAPAVTAQCRGPIPGRIDLREALRDVGRVAAMSWYGLVITPADSIVLVNDPMVCRQVAEAIASAVRVPADSFTFTLVRVRAHYVADSDRSMGAWGTRFVLDSALKLMAARDSILLPTTNAPTGPPSRSSCFSAEEAPWVLPKVRLQLTDPRYKGFRDLLGIEVVPIDSIRHVEDATTCARAVATLKTHLRRGGEHVSITLIRIGNLHLVESSWPSAGEWPLVFLLDGTATRVEGPS